MSYFSNVDDLTQQELLALILKVLARQTEVMEKAYEQSEAELETMNLEDILNGT